MTEQTCERCGRDLPEDARYCPTCGYPVGAPPPEERKIVTVLFVDLVGSADLSTRIDPERYRELVGSYYRTVFQYPVKEPTFEITFDGARADNVSGVVRATAINTGADVAPLDLVLKGWFHDPTRRVELIPNGLLLHGPSSVVAIIGTAPTSAQVSDKKRALDANLRAGALQGDGPGHIGALDYQVEIAAGATDVVRLAWAEADEASAAQARATDLLGGADEVLQFRSDEADTLFRGAVTAHEDVYRQALASLLWSQSLYTWDGASSYDPAWEGKVDARDVLIMPDTWEFPWLASWDTGFQAVTASLIDPQLAAGILSGSAGASARNSTSTIRCEVSTLPPATAAGNRQFTMLPSGARIRIGFIMPSFAGISRPTIVATT